MQKTYFIKTLLDKNNINWSVVPLGLINENGWNSKPHFESYFQIVFVKEYGFLIKLLTKEANPWANYHKDNDPVYLDSCLEAFLLFNDEEYINLETNSLGTRLQAIGNDRNNRKTIIDKNIKVIPIKKNDGWSLIIDLPFDKLSNIYTNFDVSKIKSGFSFKGNFYKTGKNPLDGVEHYYMWNRINTINPDFHQPSQFGILIIE